MTFCLLQSIVILAHTNDIRYALEDCHGSRDCDAFNLFKHLLEARAQELEGKNKFPMSEDFVGPGTYVRCRAR